MTDACLVCGEVAIVEDEGPDGCLQKVCAECGVVQSASHPLVADVNKEFSSSSDWLFDKQDVSRSMQRMLCSKHELKPKKLGLQKISEYGSILGFSQNMIEECKDLYTSSYMELFLRRMSKFKMILASSCVYCVCRRHGHAVSISKICSLAQISARDFSKVFCELRTQKGLQLPSYTLGATVANIVGTSCLENRGKLVEKTCDILQFFQKHWLVTGRRKEFLIIAAIFLAWQSDDFTSRRKSDLKKFCSQMKIPYSKTTKARLREMNQVLIEFTKQIPWMSSDSVGQNIALHLDDILKYQTSIMFDCLQNQQKDKQIVNSDTDTDSGPPDSCFDPPIAKKLKTEPSTTEQPFCTETGHDLDNEELTEVDISDSNLIRYIRTPKEVEDYICIHQIVEPKNNS